jgi:putative transposase
MPDHHPPHIYLDDTWYMVTSSIYQRQCLLVSDGHKEILQEQLSQLSREFKLHLAGWVILDNHYHILVRSSEGSELPHFFQRFHGRTSYELNRIDRSRGRQIWHNFWDTCIRNEIDYWTHLNYIHHNPVKHGYVQEMKEWTFSSFWYYLKSKGEDWLMDAFYRYPIIDYTEGDNNFSVNNIGKSIESSRYHG